MKIVSKIEPNINLKVCPELAVNTEPSCTQLTRGHGMHCGTYLQCRRVVDDADIGRGGGPFSLRVGWGVGVAASRAARRYGHIRPASSRAPGDRLRRRHPRDPAHPQHATSSDSTARVIRQQHRLCRRRKAYSLSGNYTVNKMED